MANNVIGLYDDTSTADHVVSDLRESGFSESNISRFEGDQDDLAYRLEQAGLSDEEATYYVEKLRGGGELVSVRANGEHVEDAVEIMNRYGGESDDASYAAEELGADKVDGALLDTSVNTYASPDTASGAVSADTDEARLAVAEERLAVGKREVQRGGTRVRSVVTEMPVEEQIILRDETVRVDRRPVEQGAATTGADLFTEQTFEFTETDEEAVVAKEVHVIEEVVIGKQVEERTETIRDTVRRTDVEVEELTTGATQSDYGTLIASDARFQGREWDDAETDVRTDWESSNQGRWDDHRDSVRASWDRARNR